MTERIAEVYSLLIPLADARMLVPRACVAEVIGYQVPAPMEGAPPWYLGLVNWNARSLPLVSFEGACGLPIPPASARSRIVVFHALAGRLEAGYVAIVSQGFPQLVRVSSDVVRPDSSHSFPERSPVLCQVRMLNEVPLVPDLERLEAMVAEETSVTPERELL
ncbi:MAG TPA: chemotaxis protein CheW [Steroidobacteraceae bacterium]|jgi:chemosensory pili system protein ChpC|nr:chemotaxis protein CheW [Steroidobacteraceae bacterium]